MSNPADYRYILAPVPMFTRWGQQAYGAPDDAVGWLDLRTLDMAGYGLFWGHPDMAPMVGGIDCGRGDCREMGATAFANAWEARYGVRPAGGTLVAALVDVLTTKADPAGLTAPRPLMPECPGPNPTLTVWMPGHSRVHAEKMDAGHPHFGQVQRILWMEQDEIEARALGAANATLRGRVREHARRVLDWQCEKYGLSKTRRAEWEMFLPPARRAGHPGPLPHDTSYSESFDKADSDTLGPDLTWSGDIYSSSGQTIQVFSNTAKLTNSGGESRERAEHDVSSSDHETVGVAENASTLTSGDHNCGVFARFSSSALTCYSSFYGHNGANPRRLLVKYVASAGTVLYGENYSPTSGDHNLGVRCNGSTISLYWDGSSVTSVTDTSVTSGTRMGLHFYQASSFATRTSISSISIADLAAAAVQPQLMLLGVGC